jgi:hypothetical protein
MFQQPILERFKTQQRKNPDDGQGVRDKKLLLFDHEPMDFGGN